MHCGLPLVLSLCLLVIQTDSLSLVWSDEFNGDTFNQSKWSFDKGDAGASNHELELYTNRTDNVFVKDGYLNLVARKESFNGYNYTSGRILTKGKGDWKYAHFEIRAKLPDSPGMWPALWLLPTYHVHGPGIASGEIDIMELIGKAPRNVYATAHWGKTWTDRGKKSAAYTLKSGRFSDNFHIFSLDWSPGKVQWFVDNQKFMEVTPADVPSRYVYPFDDYFHLILNVAVGGDWPGPPDKTTKFPQTMLVDYVRVYQ